MFDQSLWKYFYGMDFNNLFESFHKDLKKKKIDK